MKPNKVLSLDKISNKLLKIGGSTIGKSICYVFNLILNACILPELTPILNTSNKTGSGNYRPVSVISAVAKILKKF